MDYFSQFKATFIGLTSAIMAFLAPLAGDLYVMLILFASNALFGIIADIVDNKQWSKQKIRVAFVEALLFFLFVFLIYSIGTLKGNMSGALQCVSFISYSLMYYYGTNICRNMMQILPDASIGHKCFAFLYYLLSVEFIKQIPYLSAYLQGKSPLEAATPTDSSEPSE